MAVQTNFTLRELVAEVAEQLARVGSHQENGQVRAVPDERSVRYYTTLGLLDRPALQGRTALYGWRHLAQVVAIKRLQSAGKSLEDIQELLPALDDASLARISGVSLSRGARSRGRTAFWKATARRAELPEAALPAVAPVEGGGGTGAPRAVRSELVERVELAPGVQLSFPLARRLSEPELTALATAAGPLLEWLAALRGATTSKLADTSGT